MYVYSGGVGLNISNTLVGYSPKKVRIVSANIPNVFDNVVNISFELEGLYNVVLVDGYYTGSTLAAMLQTAMNTSGTANVYVVSYDSVSLKLTISTGVPFIMELDVDAAMLLGFSAPGIVGPSMSIVSDQPINLRPFENIVITSNLCEGVDNGINPFEGLGMVSLGNTAYGGVMSEIVAGPMCSSIQSKYLLDGIMSFSLVSDTGYPISMGFPWNVVVEFIFN